MADPKIKIEPQVAVPILYDIDSPYFRHFLETGEMIIPTETMTLAECKRRYPYVDVSHIPDEQ